MKRVTMWSSLLAAACAAGTANAQLVQWTVDQGGNGHWYGLTSGASTWDAMEAEAVIAGGHLASIASMSENQFIFSLITPSVGGPSGETACWIGLSRPGGSAWRWSDGSAFDFTAWRPGEPNNAAGQEWWGWIYGPGSYSWQAAWNDHTQYQYSLRGVIEVVPAPSSIAPLSLLAFRRSRRR